MWPFRKTNGIALPTEDWIKQHTPTHTWDMGRLEQHANQPVFIYNHMKRRHRAHEFIDEWSEFRGTAFTLNDNWIMWKKKLGIGTFPIAMKVEHTMVPTGRVKGELFLIESHRIKDLDDVLLNGVEFRRKLVEVVVPYQHVRRVVNKDHNYEEEKIEVLAKVPAWMYIGRYKYWVEHLDAGYNFKTCRRYTPQGFVLQCPYYDFTELELNDD